MNYKTPMVVGGVGVTLGIAVLASVAASGDAVDPSATPQQIVTASEVRPEAEQETSEEQYAEEPVALSQQELEDQWKATVELLLDGQAQRVEALTESAHRIWNACYGLCDHSDVEGFIEEVVSIASHASWTYDASQWRRWVIDRYFDFVFPIATYHQAVYQEAELFNARLHEIGSNVLVAIGCDTEIDPIAFSPEMFSLGNSDEFLHAEAEHSLEAVKKANNNQTATAGVGFVAGLAGDAAASSYARGQTGESNFAQALGGFLFGVVTEEVCNAVINEATQALPEAHDTIGQSAARIRERYGVDGLMSEDLINQLCSIMDQHEARSLTSAIYTTPLDYETASRLYFEAKKERSGDEQ